MITGTLTLPAYDVAAIVSAGNEWIAWAGGLLLLSLILRQGPKWIRAARRAMGAAG